jgi:hypothetical protein
MQVMESRYRRRKVQERSRRLEACSADVHTLVKKM